MLLTPTRLGLFSLLLATAAAARPPIMGADLRPIAPEGAESAVLDERCEQISFEAAFPAGLSYNFHFPRTMTICQFGGVSFSGDVGGPGAGQLVFGRPEGLELWVYNGSIDRQHPPRVTWAVDEDEGVVRVTWQGARPPGTRQLPPRAEPYQNDFQLTLRRMGEHEAEIEYRYHRCDWTDSGFLPIKAGIVNVTAGEIEHILQYWEFPESRHGLQRLCQDSNVGEPGVWRFQTSEGYVTGCGPDWGRIPEGHCDDNNATSGDGCSASCLPELDIDDDGIYESPDPDVPDLLGIYDACLFDACEDDDEDGVMNAEDNCPIIANPEQINSDDDSLGDACDPDDDNDEVLDADDLCPLIPNRYHLDADQDGIGDECDTDDDNDGFLDVVDNCPGFENTHLTDTDSDGIGDECDDDDDNDGYLDTEDNCPRLASDNLLDQDGDGIGDVCDSDRDGDGYWNANDSCPDDPNPDQSEMPCVPVADMDGNDDVEDVENVEDVEDVEDVVDSDEDGLGDRGGDSPPDAEPSATAKQGGCSTAPNAPSSAWMLLLLAWGRRRRQRGSTRRI